MLKNRPFCKLPMISVQRLLPALAILLALLLQGMLFSGCNAGSNEPLSRPDMQESGDAIRYPYTFIDSTGASVTLQKQPQKVAVLFSSYAQVWALAGGKVAISVGESVQRGFADQTCILVDQTVGHASIDTETLVAAAPDLVIGTADYEIQRKTADFCRNQGIPAASFTVETFDDYLHLLKICTDLTENSQAYQTNGVQVKQRIDTLLADFTASGTTGGSGSSQATGQSHSNGPQILFVRAGASAKSTKAKGSDDNFACAMLKTLGTQNIADKAPVLLDGLSLEQVVADDPDFIFVSTMGDETAAKDHMNDVLQSTGWKELSAVRNKRVAYLPKDLFHYKPNNRWDEAYAYLLNILKSGDAT